MVVEAALRGVPVDTARLFDDPGLYGLWIEACLEGVRDAHERITSS
jgi:hypothetical protein